MPCGAVDAWSAITVTEPLCRGWASAPWLGQVCTGVSVPVCLCHGVYAGSRGRAIPNQGPENRASGCMRVHGPASGDATSDIPGHTFGSVAQLTYFATGEYWVSIKYIKHHSNTFLATGSPNNLVIFAAYGHRALWSQSPVQQRLAEGVQGMWHSTDALQCGPSCCVHVLHLCVQPVQGWCCAGTQIAAAIVASWRFVARTTVHPSVPCLTAPT